MNRLSVLYAMMLVVGIIIGKSNLIDLIASGLIGIRLPSVTIPEGPLLEDLRLLLTLPALHYVAFALVIIVFNVLAWWMGGAENARKVVIIDTIAVVWGILSYVITRASVTASALAPVSLVIALASVQNRIKEKELILPQPHKSLASKQAPWQLEGCGTQGAFNCVSQAISMSYLSRGLPVHAIMLTVSDRSEAKEACKALAKMKAGVFDKIAVSLGLIKTELPPYFVGVPDKLGVGIGSSDEAIRYHEEVLRWTETNVIPWCKEHWAPHTIRSNGIGWTGITFGGVRDAMLASDGYAQRQFRVGYVHISIQPSRALQNLKEFVAFSDIVNEENNQKAFIPTFDAIFISYQGARSTADHAWETLAWDWKGRISREKAEIVDHMTFALQSRPGIQPSLKEVALLAGLSPIRSIYMANRVQLTPLKKGLLRGTRVNEALNMEGIRSYVRDVLGELVENGVRKEVVVTCFGQLSDDWREVVEAEVDECAIDARVSVTGLRFGSEYSFIAAEGPVITRPRFLDEPLGVWNKSRNNNEIEALAPRNLKPLDPNNQYVRVFNVYARSLGLKTAPEMFSWKRRFGGV